MILCYSLLFLLLVSQSIELFLILLLDFALESTGNHRQCATEITRRLLYYNTMFGCVQYKASIDGYLEINVIFILQYSWIIVTSDNPLTLLAK